MPHQTVEMEGTCFLFQTDNDKILIADMFACRLQVQERLAVQIEGAHLCMMMRGVKKQHSQTLVSAMLGIFRESQKTWEEFLSLLQ